MADQQKIAIFGGAFNPVHWGHLQIAKAALEQAQLDQVIWVPSYQPPHKPIADLRGSYEHRLVMIQRAIAQQPRFVWSTIERDRSGVSFAIDTLHGLQQDYPATQWFWITGVDTFQTLPHWYGHIELAQTCGWLIAPRRPVHLPQSEGAELSVSTRQICEQVCEQVSRQLQGQAVSLRWQILSMPLLDLSSSLIRDYCRQGRSIRNLVPDPVRLYLEDHPIY